MPMYMRFPDGKGKCLTLSYDDGVIQDKRLIDILKPYGIKATFNINSGLFAEQDAATHGRMSLSQVKNTYLGSGHEVATHAVTHPHLTDLSVPAITDEIWNDRRQLEEQFGGIVRGFAYPYGLFNDTVVDVLKTAGIAYARTTISTGDFRLPTDWLRLTATCHHNNPALPQLTERFVTQSPTGDGWLFYLWGHTYEFDGNDNWQVIEEFAAKVGNREDVWYATNIEVYDYITAYRNLCFSTDEKCVHNPSALTVYFEKDGELVTVLAGETKVI